MSDTNHHNVTGEGPVEVDGVHYRGLIWFLVVMALTVLISQALMLGTFKWLNSYLRNADAARSPLAVPAGALPPQPNLLYESSGSPAQNEPGYLRQFKEKEEHALTSYAFDKATGTAKIPIEKAKTLLLERGLAARPSTAPAPGAAADKAAAPAPAPAPAKAPAKAKDH
jgi:hypothetical protein